MESTSFDDCYFYFYSSCTKGSDCTFRHCEAALGTETVCSLWRQGTCYRSNCKFRHMESRIDRSTIPCYWENMPGGCRKPHCVFLHQKYRSRMNELSEAGGLILPVASQPVSPSMSVDNSMECKWEAGDSHSLSPSHPIQPVVVSLDEGEESDTESTASTPMKVIPSLDKRTSVPFRVLNDSSVNDMSCVRNLGIKTLEQIKMAKIHRESEHFYNNADEADFMDGDASSECAKLETVLNEPNTYYSQVDYSTMASEVTPLDLEAESYQDASLYPTEMNNMLHRSPKPSKPSKSSKSDSAMRDLRDVIKRKRHVAPNEEQPTTELSTKRIISLKKPSATVKDGPLALTVTFGKENEKKDLPVVICTAKVKSKRGVDNNIGFRVKTLDEIRKEKGKKQNYKVAPPISEAEVTAEEDSFDKPIDAIFDDIKKHSLDNRVKPKSSKRRLQRKPIDLYKSPQKQANDLEDSQENMILEQGSNQMSEDMVPINETSMKKVSMEILSSPESAEGCKHSISLKRTAPDVPLPLKVQKTSAIHTSRNKTVALESDGEKPLQVIEINKKTDDCLAFKRRNIMRRKNVDLPNSQPVVQNKDSECQLQNSDSQKEFVSHTPEHIVSPGQNGSLVESEHSCTETKEAKTSVAEKEAESNITSPPIVHVRSEKKSLSFSTVDELDTLLLGDGDICLEEVDANTDTKAEDLFLEFEQILQS